MIKIELNHIVEAISFLVACSYYKSLKNTFLFWVIPYLAFILMAELGASYFKYHLHKPNGHIYVIISLVEFVFYSYLFYHFNKNSKLQKVISVGSTLLVLPYLFLFFFFSDYKSYDFYLPVYTGFYLAIVASIYLYKISIKDDTEFALTKQVGFWVASGVLIFFSGISISFLLHSFLKNATIKIWGMSIYNFIPQVLSIFLYGCITIAIIVCKKKNQQLY